MAWRDQLRPGSFRGASFSIFEHEAEIGRRGELHEFPERDLPWFEDLGRAARRYAIEAFVIGPNYMAERDALVAACEARGAGTLVHPFLGTLSLVCESASFRESTEQGGMATFSIEFVEPGEALAGEEAADTASLAVDQADAAEIDQLDRFPTDFSTSGMPAFVEEAAGRLVRSTVDIASLAGALLGGSGPALRAFDAGLSQLPGGAIALVRAPLALGHAILGLVSSVAGLTSQPLLRIYAMRRLIAGPTAFPEVLGETPARIRQRANQDSFSRLVVVLAAAAAVRATAAVTFTSYDQAVAIRDGLADDLDRLAVLAADAGADADAATLDRLRRAMVRDVTARGGSLARLYSYTPAATEPALVTAHRLYRDPAIVIDRSDEIVGRNRIRHPGFVTGGRPIEVRSAEGGPNG